MTKDTESYWHEQLSGINLNGDGKLECGGILIPTTNQTDECLREIHGSKLSAQHIYNRKTLVECLKAKPYFLPEFTGGLERAVIE